MLILWPPPRLARTRGAPPRPGPKHFEASCYSDRVTPLILRDCAVRKPMCIPSQDPRVVHPHKPLSSPPHTLFPRAFFFFQRWRVRPKKSSNNGNIVKVRSKNIPGRGHLLPRAHRSFVAVCGRARVWVVWVCSCSHPRAPGACVCGGGGEGSRCCV
jgi:hypothetical protein